MGLNRIFNNKNKNISLGLDRNNRKQTCGYSKWESKYFGKKNEISKTNIKTCI